MADYGAQDTSTTSLGANQFPISEAWTPNAGFSAVEGGTQTTDAGGKKSAPVRIEVKDGSDLTQGAQADVAYTSGSGSIISLLKGIFTKLAGTLTISGAVTTSGTVTEANSATIQTNTANIGASTDAAVVGDNAGSLSAKLRGLTKILNDIWDSVNHRIHVNVDAGSITANAGTNLSTSALALEAGGHLAAIDTAQGAQADAAITNSASSGSVLAFLKGIVSLLSGVLATKRSTVAVYSLASTVTTGSTQNSGDLTVGPYTEISIDINTTAQAGTNPTIQYFYERKAADGIYYVLWQSAVLTVAANTLSTSIGAGMAYNQSLGVTGRLRWVVGGSATPTFTHSLNIQGK